MFTGERYGLQTKNTFGACSSRSADVAATGGGNEGYCGTDRGCGDNRRFSALRPE